MEDCFLSPIQWGNSKYLKAVIMFSLSFPPSRLNNPNFLSVSLQVMFSRALFLFVLLFWTLSKESTSFLKCSAKSWIQYPAEVFLGLCRADG